MGMRTTFVLTAIAALTTPALAEALDPPQLRPATADSVHYLSGWDCVPADDQAYVFTFSEHEDTYWLSSCLMSCQRIPLWKTYNAESGNLVGCRIEEEYAPELDGTYAFKRDLNGTGYFSFKGADPIEVKPVIYLEGRGWLEVDAQHFFDALAAPDPKPIE